MKDLQKILLEKQNLEFELVAAQSKVNELNRLLKLSEIEMRNQNNKTESIKRAVNFGENERKEYELKINNLYSENENLREKIEQLLKNQISINDIKVKHKYYFQIFSFLIKKKR